MEVASLDVTLTKTVMLVQGPAEHGVFLWQSILRSERDLIKVCKDRFNKTVNSLFHLLFMYSAALATKGQKAMTILKDSAVVCVLRKGAVCPAKNYTMRFGSNMEPELYSVSWNWCKRNQNAHYCAMAKTSQLCFVQGFMSI